jgi:hypothetical protein
MSYLKITYSAWLECVMVKNFMSGLCSAQNLRFSISQMCCGQIQQSRICQNIGAPMAELLKLSGDDEGEDKEQEDLTFQDRA